MFSTDGKIEFALPHSDLASLDDGVNAKKALETGRRATKTTRPQRIPAIHRSINARGLRAGLAQLVEHVICNHGVTGSNPVAGTDT